MTVVAVDLFAGAGGLGIGARLAGASLRVSVEIDPVACLTLKRNGDGGEVVQADVTDEGAVNGGELRRLAQVTRDDRLVVVGGAPCQPFSKAAYWLENGEDAAYRRARARGERVDRPAPPTAIRPDGRRSLVDDYVRLVAEMDADGFVFENVPSILHPRNRPVVDRLQRVMRARGYKVTLVKANAADFGVAQRRQRVFVLGSRTSRPEAPTSTHTEDPDQNSDLLAAVTAGEVLHPYAGSEFHEPGEEVTGRYAKHLHEIPAGWNYKWHTAWAGHPSPTFETETRFWSFLLKLDPDRPSWTIAANPGPWVGPFHWDTRRLRTVEQAALQAFPAGYEFAGNRRERVRQIGNAVPPPLARPMVGAVMATFSEQDR